MRYHIIGEVQIYDKKGNINFYKNLESAFKHREKIEKISFTSENNKSIRLLQKESKWIQTPLFHGHETEFNETSFTNFSEEVVKAIKENFLNLKVRINANYEPYQEFTKEELLIKYY